VTTRKRRTSSNRRSSTRRRTTTRRRVSPASTLGTAVGAAMAGLLIALVAGLPWWGWVLLIVAGLVLGALWAIRRGRAVDGADVSPADTDPPGGSTDPPGHPAP